MTNERLPTALAHAIHFPPISELPTMASPRVVLLAALAYLCTNTVEGFVPAPSLSSCGAFGASCGIGPAANAGLHDTSASACTALLRVAFRRSSPLHATFVVPDDTGDERDDENEDEEDDEEEVGTDPYMEKATSEFLDGGDTSGDSSSSLAPMGATSLDWGGALDTLRDRVDDIESGKSGPSNALFRLMSAETPNQAIGKFIQEAEPSVIQAMSGAVSSLLGGLSNPSTGIEVVVKANGEKLGNLCFQLMMTGYLFRNAEYVLALKDLIGLRHKASVKDYGKAFDKIDSDNSGYIGETSVGKTNSFPCYAWTLFLVEISVRNERAERGRTLELRDCNTGIKQSRNYVTHILESFLSKSEISVLVSFFEFPSSFISYRGQRDRSAIK